MNKMSSLATVVGAVLCTGALLLISGPVYAQTCVERPSDLVSWWPGDINARDIQDGNHGTLSNGAQAGVAGKVDGAFGFDGVNDFVQLPSAVVPATGDFTIALWAFPNVVPDNDMLVTQHPALATNGRMVFNATAGGFGIFIGHSSGNFSVGGAPIDVGAFNHVAVTRSGSLFTLYKNGVAVGSGTSSYAILSETTRIGAIKSGGSSWNGLIDEVGIFDRALSASEIQEIFDAGSAGKCKLPVVPPGFLAEVYATFPTRPGQISFDANDNLYVGNFNFAGGDDSPVHVYQISPITRAVTAFGAPIADPDSLIVDLNGSIGGIGSVLVGGIVFGVPGAQGRITEITSGGSTTAVLFEGGCLGNMQRLAFDGGGRLFAMNFNQQNVCVIENGVVS